MKKLFLGLMATVMFGIAGYAQSNANAYNKSGMVVLVTQARSTYSKGASYNDWLVSQFGTSKISTPEEDKFLKDVYGFLSTGVNSDGIYKNYDGNSMADLAKLQKEKGLTFIGNSSRCGFWCELIIKIIQMLLESIPNMP